jgi:hypothetical protein
MKSDYVQRIDARRVEAGKYHEAVGRLVLAWSQVEQTLYKVLKGYCKVSDAVALALIAGNTRFNVMAGALDRLAANGGMDPVRYADLKKLLDQAATLNTFRDNISHFGDLSFSSRDDEGETRHFAVIQNRDVRSNARNGKIIEFEVSAVTIDLAVEDMKRIHSDLVRHLDDSIVPNSDCSPWLHKSPQPKVGEDKSRSTGNRPAPQRPPSRQKR